ncbi:MAG: sigma-70 family RNA polymerase sigma factor [Caldilineaceae bacterium]
MITYLPYPTQLEQYMATATRLAIRLLGSYDAAEDAVQEGLIKAYRAWGGFEGSNLRAWFLCIIRNTCYDHLRAQKRRPTESLEAMFERENNETSHLTRYPSLSPDQIVLQQERMQAILHMIEALPSDYRMVLQLVDLEGYGYAEVSTILNIPMGTVKSRLCRGRSLVRDQLVRDRAEVNVG